MGVSAQKFRLWVDKEKSLCYARLVHNTSAHSIQILYALPTEYLEIVSPYN